MTLIMFLLMLAAAVIWAGVFLIAANHMLREQRERFAYEVLDAMYREPLRTITIEQPLLIANAKAPKFDATAGEIWIRQATEVALRIYAERGEVTGDDVWRECPAPSHVDGRLMSRVFNRSDWMITGYRQSARGRNAERKMAIWKRKIAEAAE